LYKESLILPFIINLTSLKAFSFLIIHIFAGAFITSSFILREKEIILAMVAIAVLLFFVKV
jgi:hypothetical protein